MTASLDAIVIDCMVIDCADLPAKIQTVYDTIRYRLKCVNLDTDSNIAFIASSRVIEQFPSDYPIRLVKDDYVSNNGYLLTVSSGGQEFILPPNGMSWEDYFLSIYRGLAAEITVLAPWAQARFINLDKLNE